MCTYLLEYDKYEMMLVEEVMIYLYVSLWHTVAILVWAPWLFTYKEGLQYRIV